MIKKRINKFQEYMKNKDIDFYIITTSDYHGSEYASDYFKSREYFSGFTGSNGDLLIMQDEAILWTDGRYFIQAENELDGSGIQMYKMGVEGYPTMLEYVRNNIKEGNTISFDPKTMPLNYALLYEDLVYKNNAKINITADIINELWSERPEFPKSKIYNLDIKYTGKDSSTKLKELRESMKKLGAKTHIISSLHDIAWLYNFRADDIECTPVAMAYTIVTLDNAHLFCSIENIETDLKDDLIKLGVELHDYFEFYDFLNKMKYDDVLIDNTKVNYQIYFDLGKKNIINAENPTIIAKAIKNKVELENIRKAHIIDGVAVTKFMHWLKTNYKNGITEIQAEDKALEFRKESKEFVDLSFTTISATGANAAMMHYSANRENSTVVKEGDLFLLDSGGQYYEGTTDITRTYAVGEISDEYKKHYTMVLQGVIDLTVTKFLYGCRGTNLDILARQIFWKQGLDYRSGTGHGVGHMLGVHEGPNGFRWRIVPERDDSCLLEEGMVTTVEPGVYIDNSHGIRIENMLVCKKGIKNEYGQFMEFENVALSPIDLDAINVDMLNKEQRKYLNDYHKEVYEKISPYLNEEQKAFLKEYTREV